MNGETLSCLAIGMLVAIAGCGGPQTGNTASPSGSGMESGTAAPVGGVGPEVAPTVSAAETGTPAATGTGTSAGAPSAVVSPTPDKPAPVHSVSSATGAPASTGVSTAVPGAPLTPDELEKVAMCVGKKSMFTAKEEKLLKLAEESGQDTLKENAAAIRQRRQDQLKKVCDDLRAAGKL